MVVDGARDEVDLLTDLDHQLLAFARAFDHELERWVTPPPVAPRELGEAMRYAVLAPGKRLRPYLVVRGCELVGGGRSAAWPAAAAVECIHAFSLVHDDLPAMDDDDLRRGRPTCHRRFGEAVAILAGDALAVLAFEILATHVSDASRGARLIQELASATGWGGIIGGQAADILSQHQSPSLEQTQGIHQRKTARLFEAACRLGALSGGADERRIETLGRFGALFGLAFQIADDLLDATAAASVGKQTGKDLEAGKQTYPRCVGLVQSRRAAEGFLAEATRSLSGFGDEADDLRALARYAMDRTR